MDSLLNVVALFCEKVGLPHPTEEKDVFTFIIEEQEINITQLPAGHLLMFSTLPDHYIENYHQIEIYSNNLYKPSIGWSQDAYAWVMWNRQPFEHLDINTIYQQAFNLSEGYAQASIKATREPVPEPQMNNLFSTAIKA